jgi:hypothetical protein
VTLLEGGTVPVINTEHGVSTTRQDQPIDPKGGTRAVRQTFGEVLPEVQAAMAALPRRQPIT